MTHCEDCGRDLLPEQGEETRCGYCEHAPPAEPFDLDWSALDA